MKLEDALKKIGNICTKSQDAAKKRLDSLVKPAGSLGRLEDLVIQIAGITGSEFPKLNKKTIIVMCADNGVVEEGVSSFPKSVTAAMAVNFTKGTAAVNALGSHAGADIRVVDIGIDGELEAGGIINRKIRRGTWNIAKGPAMTREEAVKAIETGIDIVCGLAAEGTDIFGTGEMGIGNTTTSSAITAVFAGKPAGLAAGRGAGLTDEGLERKINTIRRAIEVNRPDPSDPLDVLAKLGGFDIAGMIGCFIGAAACRKPILIDGFISSVAALAASRIKPETKAFMIASHRSAEPGSGIVLDMLGLEPLLSLGMRLGEGTGAALAFQIIDAAFEAYRKMGKLEDAI